jgi:U3 small nucleolar ribonucleoprotein protein LCP5
MATATALSEVLVDFTSATEAAIQGLPSSDSLLPPENGITLFNTKNELFLSYLQALALRNLNVIRSIKAGGDLGEAQKLSNEITEKLVEQRLYLERGVKPLEQRLKYEVDRVVKAAEDEERLVAQKVREAGRAKTRAKDTLASDDSEESDSDAELGADMTARGPQVAAAASKTADAVSAARDQSREDGVYRPPRISATAMPTTDRREKSEARTGRSATLDEYVSTELTDAPTAQPSIGSNLAAGGRSTKNARQMKEEAERRDYEETHLTRLPLMSKKERAKRGLGPQRDGGFGGEEWRGLDMSVDRIGDLTKRKDKDSTLDRSRKRRAVEDGPRGDGMGSQFDMKKRRLAKKGR